MVKWVACVLAVVAGIPALRANEQEFAFALPEQEGRISLGVYDRDGALVRTLAVRARETDFKIGLNGLIARWDGRDNAGRELPRGRYFARGFVVPDSVRPEGVGYHFNDWVTDDDSPRVARIDDIDPIPDGWLLAFVDAVGTRRYGVWKSPDGFVWTNSPAGTLAGDISSLLRESGALRIGSGREYGISVGGGHREIYRISDGRLVDGLEKEPEAGRFLDVSDDRFWWTEDGRIFDSRLPDGAPDNDGLVPADFLVMATDGKRWTGGTAGAVWFRDGQDWMGLGELAVVPRSLALGSGKTFWVAGPPSEGGSAIAGQFDESGGFLRSYQDGLPVRAVRTTEAGDPVVLEGNLGTSRVRLLTRSAEGRWEILFEKTIVPAKNFGLLGGELVADCGSEPQAVQQDVSVRGMKGRDVNADVAPILYAGGLWLAAGRGLPVVQVAPKSRAMRIVVAPGPPAGSMRILAGDGASVSEYAVSGLSTMVVLEAGEIDLK